MPRSSTHIPFLRTERDLQEFCDRALAQGPDAVGLDTEFLPEKRYQPLLCLVQLATREEIVLVDPIAIEDLSPLKPLMEESVVVVHSGEQDLKLLGEAMGGSFRHVFDTQIAAALLGPKEQVGYLDLVAERLQVQLDKQTTLTHWDRRPLSSSQLQYAAADVRHLLPLYDALKEDLAARDRLKWAYEEVQRILGVAGPGTKRSRYKTPDDGEVKTRAYRRLPQTWRLTRQQLAVLKAMWEWRDARAAETDAIPKRIMGDHTLVRIATSCPTTIEALHAIRGVPRNWPEPLTFELLEMVAEALALTPEEWPAAVGSPHLSPEMRMHLDVLQLLVRYIAQQEDLAPGLLAWNDLLKPYLTQSFPTRAAFDGVGALRGWRQELLADPLWDWLSGHLTIRFKPGRRSATGEVIIERD